MEEQKSAQQQLNIQTVLDSLKIRTMTDDLKRSSQLSSAVPTAPAKVPGPAPKLEAKAPGYQTF